MVRPKFPMRKSIFLCACPPISIVKSQFLSSTLQFSWSNFPILIMTSPFFMVFNPQIPQIEWCSHQKSWSLGLKNPVVSGRFPALPHPMGIFPAFPRRCWAWKERLLGDGHDFFIPRPKTTRRLCGWLVSTASKAVPLEEVRRGSTKKCVEMVKIWGWINTY